LSQGRVDATTGCLQCSYHGWEFNAEGKCTGQSGMSMQQSTQKHYTFTAAAAAAATQFA
jgi:phenylpropionate dioxygenase-like ring-hydroxylating dioxygenase large terminal subunit